MIFHHANKAISYPLPDISISNTSIDLVHSTKFLGIIVDENLSWKPHIDIICKKTAKSCGLLYKIRPFILHETALTIYYSLIHSYLNYCVGIWGRNFHSVLQPIVRIQKRAIRNILNIKNFREHTAPLFLQLNILNIPRLAIFQCARLIFNVHLNLAPSTIMSICRKSPHSTHSNS